MPWQDAHSYRVPRLWHARRGNNSRAAREELPSKSGKRRGTICVLIALAENDRRRAVVRGGMAQRRWILAAPALMPALLSSAFAQDASPASTAAAPITL